MEHCSPSGVQSRSAGKGISLNPVYTLTRINMKANFLPFSTLMYFIRNGVAVEWLPRLLRIQI